MAMKTTKKEVISQKPAIIYVTRDIERALGREPSGSSFIVTNDTPYAELIRQKYPDSIFLIKNPSGSGEIIDTFDLMKIGEMFINEIIKKSNARILVFKNTNRIEELCAGKKWKLLNPSAALAEKIENKITQVAWLGSDKDGAEQFLPPHAIMNISEIEPKKLKTAGIAAPYMVQWAHGHTGDSTIFIGSDKTGEKTLAALREKFPNREARVTSYVKGPVFTANICIDPSAANPILIGNISNQITGMLPFTDNPWTTVGNDWSVTHSILDEGKIAQFNEIANAVGRRMIESDWIGLFGIDCIYDIERNNLHLIEVNARQPASTTYESRLQEKNRTEAPDYFKECLTVFEAHIAALENIATAKTAAKKEKKLIEINDGAQIILRIPATKELRKTLAEAAHISAELRAKNYTVIEYSNVKPGADLLRIQSEQGIMESENKFNKRGKEIVDGILSV